MNKFSGLSKVLRAAEKRLPEILTATGILCEYAAIVDAVRHTPQAELLIKAREEELGRKLTKTEVVQTCWKCYIPTVIESTVGTTCIIGGAIKYRKQNGAIMALYSLSESALNEYKKKLEETVGPEKAKQIESEIIESHVQELDVHEPINDRNRRLLAKPGTVPCYDEFSGRIFYSSEQEIKNAIIELSESCFDNSTDTVSLNDYYYLVGLEPIPIGNEFGWSLSKGLPKVFLDSHLLGGIPYMSVIFKNRPHNIARWDY